MKKIILFLVLCFSANVVMAADYSYAAAPAQKPCQATEQAMMYELSLMGKQQTIEDHVKTARIYKTMSYRGCGENSKMYKDMSRASIQAARGLVDIADFNDNTRRQYDNMINNATIKNY